jgi:membrane-bound lytic murein transglycosylase A
LSLRRLAGWLVAGPLALLALAGAAAAQPAPPDPAPARPVWFSDLPGWPGDAPLAMLPALLGSCQAIGTWGENPLGGAGELARLGASPAAWAGVCAEAAALAERLGHPLIPAPSPGPHHPPDRARLAAQETAEREALLRDFLERRFQPFAAGEGLLTGYYEPQLRGAENPAPPFLVPLHGMPPGAAAPATLPATAEAPAAAPPLPDRAAIEAGALDGRGLEVAWVDDPVEAFFLHIQGSGRILLQDGRLLRLGYAGRNGHPYRSIGRLLIDQGMIPREAMSMQAIRAWLATAEPGAAAAVLRHNPSYIFFRPLEGLRPDQGPLGAMGVPLTPERSLAVDPAFIPYGAPVFVAARDPLDGAALHRLLVAQDTGGAIRGPARGDVFWGWGEAAAARAGRMRELAQVFVLVPREPPRPEDAGILMVEETAHPTVPLPVPLAELAGAPPAAEAAPAQSR